MKPTPLPIRDDHITLAQAVKVAGLVGTGGEAKIRIREGEYHVNGGPENRPAKKLHAGDRFGQGNQEWVVTK